MAKIHKLMVGESLVGDGNEVAHIDLIIGPRGSAAESAFANALINNKDGFTSLLAVLAPNLAVKPHTVLFNKVTIKGAKQAVQMFGPAQHAVAKAVADSVADGTIPAAEADDVFICVGVFIHWDAADDKKIHDFNYQAVKESIERAVNGKPTPAEVVSQRDSAKHPFSPKLNSSPIASAFETQHAGESFSRAICCASMKRRACGSTLFGGVSSIMAMRIRSMAERAPSFCLSWVQLLAIVL